MDALLAAAAAAPQSRFRYRCSQCGQVHIGLPDVCFATPDAIRDLPEAEFADKCLVNQDICIVGGDSYFIYCVLEVPVINYPDRFGWGVWCKTGWTPFKRYWETISGAEEIPQPPVGGVLTNELSEFPKTNGLKCEIVFQQDGFRPLVILPPSRHELYRIQQEGLTVDQAVAQAQSVGTLLLVA